MKRDLVQRYRVCFIMLASLLCIQTAYGQKKSLLCQQDNALDTLRQQIELSKTINNPNQRIAILIRAADLLWPIQEAKARETFSEAFELALQTEREAGGQRTTSLLMFKQDQRYVVVRAVAKRDAAFAKKLTERILADQADAKSTNTDEKSEVMKAQRLLESAIQLLQFNVDLSLDLARKSLQYPASHMITRFLYALAAQNQPSADQFYEQALTVYAERPMREFLYLKAYPFALDSDVDMPVTGSYQVPANLVANPALRTSFVRVLLSRSQQALEVPLDDGDNFNWTPGTHHILQTLNVLEPYLSKDLPVLLPELKQARERILVALPLDAQNDLAANQKEEAEAPRSFEKKIEAAEKLPDPKKRFDAIVSSILNSSNSDDFNELLKAVGTVDELEFRQVLSDWLHFRQAKIVLAKSRFDESEKLVAKVEGRLERAHLLIEIAKALSKLPESKTRVTELLDRAVAEVQKLEPSTHAARELLTIATLVANTNRSRALALLSEAARLVNRIENPDFTVGDQSLEKQFRRRSNPGHFIVRFYMPGADPETAFREVAIIDYDSALTQTSMLTDTFTRTSATLAVVDVCLKKLQQPRRNHSSNG